MLQALVFPHYHEGKVWCQVIRYNVDDIAELEALITLGRVVYAPTIDGLEFGIMETVSYYCNPEFIAEHEKEIRAQAIYAKV